MAPHIPPQQGQSSLVGGVCCDGNMGDMDAFYVFRKLGPYSSIIPVLDHLQCLIMSSMQNEWRVKVWEILQHAGPGPEVDRQ